MSNQPNPNPFIQDGETLFMAIGCIGESGPTQNHETEPPSRKPPFKTHESASLHRPVESAALS